MKIAGYCLIGLGVLDLLLSLIEVDITGWDKSAWVLLVAGGFFLWYGKEKGKVTEFEGSLHEGETLLKSGKASIKEGGIFNTKQENGSMVLTNRRLLYWGSNKSDKEGVDNIAEVGSNDFELSLGEISSVEIKFPNVIIKDKDNNEFKVILFKKKIWKDEILKAVSETD